MPFVYIGRTHNFIGKSAWEICCSLKDYGVGRIIVRQMQVKRYAEPCFMRIVQAEPLMDKDNHKLILFVEQIFRGQHKGVVPMTRVSYKTDYQLIPKHEEYKYIKAFEEFKQPELKIFDPRAEMPALLKIVAETRGHNQNYFNMTLKDVNSQRARVAGEGETPNIKASFSLGTPIYPQYYEGVLEKYGQQENS